MNRSVETCHHCRSGNGAGVVCIGQLAKRIEARMALRLACLAALVISGCAPSLTRQTLDPSTRVQEETFGYRSWVAKGVRPDVVIIGIHGFCGAAKDYANLGTYLLRNQPQTAVYAYEVRGQGSDPLRARRGDIGNPRQWYADLETFTAIVRQRHPEAKIIWFGESMGGLIATHALCQAPVGALPCDGLVLSSPIVRVHDDVPGWKQALLKVAGATVPGARISLDPFVGAKQIQMTGQSTHGAQSATNAYHIERHTLRLLATLARHIEGMPGCAASIRVPVLVLRGEKDFLSEEGDVRRFVESLPDGIPRTHHEYAGAHHLLMYDARRDDVFRDVARWSGRLRREKQ
jgi:alpha-beta hydrolase superfamily lysophospholipase